ncbi:MAG: polyphosphate kinase 2 family protein [Anaerofustis sp.]
MDLKQYEFSGEKKFEIKKFNTADTGKFKERSEAETIIQDDINLMKDSQDKLYSENREGILIIFQAMDAAGKDGAIKHVFSGLNPQGVDVFNFKQPTDEELKHDYLWRAQRHVPQRGKIAIFNRSYYEDVLVAKVHKLYLSQVLPDRCKDDSVIEKRYTQIKNYEQYLWENGITVIKFFLNISKDEQKKQLLQRIDDQSKNWKFSQSDIEERKYWDDYQDAYEAAINETSTPICPWYVIPADKKWYSRYLISKIVLQHLQRINPQYPKLAPEVEQSLSEWRKTLLA